MQEPDSVLLDNIARLVSTIAITALGSNFALLGSAAPNTVLLGSIALPAIAIQEARIIP